MRILVEHVQEEYIYSNHDNVYSPQGFDVEIDYPEGSTVTHRQNWTEVKKVEDGKVKVWAGRNRSVFWRQDTIDITYPNGMTVSIPFEQPGDEIFNSMEFSATISADIENTDYTDGETTTFQANFGEMEGAYSQSYWSYELPTSFSWDKHDEITGGPPYRHTEKVLNVLGGQCRVEFHHY